MAELTRRIIDRDHTRTWVVRGTEGAIALHAVKHAGAEFFVGLAVHRIHTDGPDVDACNVLDGQPCEVDALSNERGRDLFEFRGDDGVIFGALTLEYRRVWPGDGLGSLTVVSQPIDDAPLVVDFEGGDLGDAADVSEDYDDRSAS